MRARAPDGEGSTRIYTIFVHFSSAVRRAFWDTTQYSTALLFADLVTSSQILVPRDLDKLISRLIYFVRLLKRRS